MGSRHHREPEGGEGEAIGRPRPEERVFGPSFVVGVEPGGIPLGAPGREPAMEVGLGERGEQALPNQVDRGGGDMNEVADPILQKANEKLGVSFVGDRRDRKDRVSCPG